MTLAFLAGYRTQTFGGVAQPRAVLHACGESVGIFLGHGTEWQHFRVRRRRFPGRRADEVYDAEHAPAIGWRYAVTGR